MTEKPPTRVTVERDQPLQCPQNRSQTNETHPLECPENRIFSLSGRLGLKGEAVVDSFPHLPIHLLSNSSK
ncbi:hypothetical protein ACKFKG_19725 [Phormidesmis sp. 146-35]